MFGEGFMDLEFLLKNPTDALNYAEIFVNFRDYFENRLSDDINYTNVMCEDTDLFLIKENIKQINLFEEKMPDFFILNSLEKEKNYGGIKLQKVTAKRTSSPRSFLIPELKLYVKTHFSGRISSNFRGIDEDLITKTINLSKSIGDTIYGNENVSFFHEFGGMVWNNIGCIYRSGNPFPRFQGALIPIHSLFGIDYNKPNDLPLFVQIANEKSMKPEDFAVYEIIEPILKSWVWFTFDKRQRITCHGQNVLYGISYDLKKKRIIHRDVQKDKYDGKINDNLRLKISRDYDFIIGHLLLDKIKNTNREYVDGKNFIEKIKEIYKTYNLEGFMLKNRVYEKGVGEKKKTIETEIKPKYR